MKCLETNPNGYDINYLVCSFRSFNIITYYESSFHTIIYQNIIGMALIDKSISLSQYIIYNIFLILSLPYFLLFETYFPSLLLKVVTFFDGGSIDTSIYASYLTLVECIIDYIHETKLMYNVN